MDEFLLERPETSQGAVAAAMSPEVELERARELRGGNARASWRFSADHVRQGLQHCTPAKKEVLLWCFQWCTGHDIHAGEFAERVGHDLAILEKIYTGRHAHPGTGIRYDIPDSLHEAALAFRREEVRAKQDADSGFVVTPTVRRIWNACGQARASRSPVFLYGASHLGKTWALSRYATEHAHGRTAMVRVPAASGLGGLVDAIARRCGVSEKGNTKDKIGRLRNALDPGMVLILDDVHQLVYTYRRESFFSCLEVIRDLYDHTRCGMVLCTTNVFRDEFETASKRQLEQLFRRGVHRVQLGDIVRAGDLRPIVEHQGLAWPGPKETVRIAGISDRPYEILRQLARQEGLKAVTERLRYGAVLAAKAEETLDWRHFVHAHLIIENNAKAPADDWE